MLASGVVLDVVMGPAFGAGPVEVEPGTQGGGVL